MTNGNGHGGRYDLPYWNNPPTLNPLAAFGGLKFEPSAEENEEFKMTFGESRKKPAFSIFADASGTCPSPGLCQLCKDVFVFE